MSCAHNFDLSLRLGLQSEKKSCHGDSCSLSVSGVYSGCEPYLVPCTGLGYGWFCRCWQRWVSRDEDGEESTSKPTLAGTWQVDCALIVAHQKATVTPPVKSIQMHDH